MGEEGRELGGRVPWELAPQTPFYFPLFPCLYQILLQIYLQNKGKIQEHLLYQSLKQ